VVHNEALLGYVTRDKLTRAIEPIRADIEAGADNSEKCTFRPTSGPDEEYIDLSDTIEESVLRLRKEVPLEFVVRMFQRLNLRQILFTHGGKLVGMVTKSDVVSLLTMHFPHTAALQEGPVST